MERTSQITRHIPEHTESPPAQQATEANLYMLRAVKICLEVKYRAGGEADQLYKGSLWSGKVKEDIPSNSDDTVKAELKSTKMADISKIKLAKWNQENLEL